MTLLQGLVMALLFYLLVMVTGHYVWEHSLRLLLVFLVLALLRLYIFLKKKREFLPG